MIVRFGIGVYVAFLVALAYLMSPWHYGNDGYMGTLQSMHFSDFAVVRYRVGKQQWAKLCIGKLTNCRVMYGPGDKGHKPRVTACGDDGSYHFCQP